ncbi:MAG: helix-turn-helix transcriptional regulator [Clostridiales bacterium]|nr:helix-turn-helix transcriptional regulator [Clostridiales bacterium]
MLKQALTLWKKERTKKGTTLRRRLQSFFLSVSLSLVLLFALLLIVFGITGTGESTVHGHLETELFGLVETINDDFGRAALGGISIAEDLTLRSDHFFAQQQITAAQLPDHPELLEPLLAAQIQTLISTVRNRYCGGAFVLLDATVQPDTSDADRAKAGIFLKKTLPTATDIVGVDIHYLRGPAQIARDHGIMLIGQWRMEYDIEGQEFFTHVMEIARQNPDLPLSRLYYWTPRVTLKGNSESGFLLCVPLRSNDGTVFGLCGIEISDRLFKSFYTPKSGVYENLFTLMAPSSGSDLLATEGLIAGNYYLTGSRWTENLLSVDTSKGLLYFSAGQDDYGGLTAALRLYPEGSPYSEASWAVALLMPRALLDDAAKGNVVVLICIVLVLLALSSVASILISRRYLHPVTEALQSIRQPSADERKAVPYVEISDLLDFLEEKDRGHEEALREREEDRQQLLGQYEQAQRELSRLAYSRKTEVDPDLYQQFLNHLSTLTPTEREVFDLYLAGKHAKEILEILSIKENTLKYHNKNIYSKLGVTSRKELLRYAALMQQESK